MGTSCDGPSTTAHSHSSFSFCHSLWQMRIECRKRMTVHRNMFPQTCESKFGAQPPICSWCTSKVSPSAMSSCIMLDRPWSILKHLRWETNALGSIIGSHPCTVEKKSHSGHLLALTLAESVHQFLQWCGPLDLEEDFIVVVCDLDIQVLNGRSRLVLLRGHFEELMRG